MSSSEGVWNMPLKPVKPATPLIKIYKRKIQHWLYKCWPYFWKNWFALEIKLKMERYIGLNPKQWFLLCLSGWNYWWCLLTTSHLLIVGVALLLCMKEQLYLLPLFAAQSDTITHWSRYDDHVNDHWSFVSHTSTCLGFSSQLCWLRLLNYFINRATYTLNFQTDFAVVCWDHSLATVSFDRLSVNNTRCYV